MLKIRSIRFGGHSLSVCFSITNLADLEAAMKAVADRGGRIFEMPFLLCKLAWKDVAEAAIRAGIKEISFCHFWPKDKNGNPVCGDPLGNEEQFQKALSFFDNIIEATQILRANNIQVRFIDGPTWGVCLDTNIWMRKACLSLKTYSMPKWVGSSMPSVTS